MRKLFCITLVFLHIFSNPRNALELMPLPLWNEIADYLEPNDKALIHFIAPNLGLTDDQAEGIVNFIFSKYLKESKNIKDLILHLKKCAVFKTLRPGSNACKVIKKLKYKIDQLSIVNERIKNQKFNELNTFFYKKQINREIVCNDLQIKNRLEIFKKDINSDLLILNLILNQELTQLKKIFKIKNNCLLIYCVYLLFEFGLFTITNMGADMDQYEINIGRYTFYVLIVSLFFSPEIIYSVPFRNNLLFLACTLNGESYDPEESLVELSKQFEPIKKLKKHINNLLKISY